MDRKQKIMHLLSQRKTMSCSQLCDELFCSVSSLRRDLIELEKSGVLRRTRGGATLSKATNFDYSFDFRSSDRVAQKEYICEIVRDFLSNGMNLFLDASTTVAKICPILESLQGITVVTNGLGTALMLNKLTHVKTFVTGGQLRESSSSLVGESAGSYFDNCNADLAIISCRGIDEHGVYEADLAQAEIKRHMMKNAKRTLLLADSTKFSHTYMHRLCEFYSLQAIITNCAPEPRLEEAILSAECEVLY